ncbi:MAG: cobalamin 5'-phosphate synthase [Nitrospirae bacterium GWD2_57_9]|nr:MAG: cobalamin 5'-phosphate synthase [Nitrospirae bacterium GWD2_57_9]OGW48246.1 MAG: cobalamin 5'-phosphate synthase [Nitrospirae bacterium GWC2_57_9]
MVKNLITAVQFLTIFTLKREYQEEERSLPRSIVFFPVVGFLIGFLLVNADKVMMLIALPQGVANILLVALSVLVTRALHVDGLADTLDGLMGGRDRESRLAIMRDSRLGTAGAVGIFFVLFLKYVTLNNLFESEKVAALLTAPLLARWSQTIMVYNARYGRDEGMGKAFVGHLRASGLAAASAVAMGLSAFVVYRLDARSVVLIVTLLAGVLLLTFLARSYLHRKLGGVTGDSIGAVSELNEVLVLLLCVVFSNGNQP